MKYRTIKKVGKFQFKRPPNPKIRRNERLRKRAIGGRLTTKELEFILSKLKSATYQGSEFEQFYTVWIKLSTKLESSKKQK